MIKRDKAGQPKKFKARAVFCGHLQVFQHDYVTVYAPIVNLVTCLPTLMITFTIRWYLKHVDVTAVFFNEDNDRELYIQYPYNLPSCKQMGTVYRLHKSLYRLKQGLLVW